MIKSDKYIRDGNSDELSKKFHDRAWSIATDLNKQLLTLSTGIIAAIFFLIFNKKQEFKTIDEILILLTILGFGVAIFFIILGMQWDASKYYFLGHINDSTKQDIFTRDENEKLKRAYNVKQRRAKRYALYSFLAGIAFSFLFITSYLFRV